ncbi:uncharacterized protein MYCFIDRAFT_85159 [Pseudocercospora fijiensis CIRAD86]|uniref:Mtf2-like C-terminal domain-containing protein n=1 Tax=Pseudocercospora fijiensis (strain CIRAD86) TaxID=383855 RepID=M3A8E9_PSEFD|nr:uncharacterized protein MYCFIDRAFT_85159 [Pseudocercospora fijiensis CIRAD86]EME80896.1 hypothetical protein MYCFIDRAFT_85159 [Pseudocercospora fijiensis CIRAD86]
MYARKSSKAVSRHFLADAPILPFLYATSTVRRGYATDGPAYHITSQEEVEAEPQIIRKHLANPRRDPVVIRRPRKDPTLSERRSLASSRPKGKKMERIPFEGSTGSANPDERFENTTMTPRELRIFEELFRQGVKTKPDESKKQFISRTQHEFPDLLQPLAEEAEHMRQQAALEARAEDPKKLSKREDFEIKDKQSRQIKKRMDEAQTDVELFQVLESEVFSRVRGLGEDGPIDSAKYAALPALLQHYISLIEKHYPGSPLGMVLLPELRKLGPSAFALGASTGLYNQHMRMLWEKYTDVDGIVDILTEMDKEVFSFNDDTLELLDQMFEHAASARRGYLGPGRRALWSTDRKERALEKLRKWRAIAGERSETAALREARKQQEILEHDEIEQDATQRHAVAA